MPAPSSIEKSPNVGHSTFIVFEGDPRLKGVLDNYGFVYSAEIGDNTKHAMIIDPRFDYGEICAYIVELGGTIILNE